MTIDVPSWNSATLNPQALLIYNTRTGRSTGLHPIGAPIWSDSRVLDDLARPLGMSRSHWRKIKRDRKPKTITVEP